MQKLLVCRYVGQNQGVGGRGRGQGGYLKLFTSDCGMHIAVGKDMGLWGWGNDGGGEGGGEGGWGEALIEVLNQNRYHYIQFGYQNAYNETKLAEIAILGGFP